MEKYDHKTTHEIADGLLTASVLLVRMLRNEESDHGLSTAQKSVLTRLITEGKHTISDLAKAERVKVPTMTRLIQRLEYEGFVVRSKDEYDQRISQIDYTSKAWRAMEHSQNQRTNSLKNKIDHLSKDEVKILIECLPILKKLVATQ